MRFSALELSFLALLCGCAAEAGSTDGPSSSTNGNPLSSSYEGCYTDDAARALPANLGGGHTVESCIAAAAAAGYSYAGLQFYGQCFGGNTKAYTAVSDAECNTPCTANPAETCGGVWRNSIYSTQASAPTLTCVSEVTTTLKTRIGTYALDPAYIQSTDPVILDYRATTECGAKASADEESDYFTDLWTVCHDEHNPNYSVSGSFHLAEYPQYGSPLKGYVGCQYGYSAIQVTYADYGSSCGIYTGNATSAVAATCDGLTSCTYVVDYRVLGDPAPACAKDFTVTWNCGNNSIPQSLGIPAEAGFGSAVTLTCP